MKKTNKTFKRFAAITSASLLAACAMAPVFTSMTSYAEAQPLDFTLSAPSLPDGAAIQKDVSAYEVFKISKVANATGQYNVENWGEDVDASALITALNANTTDFQVQDKDDNGSLKFDGEDPVMVNLFKDVVYPTDSTAEDYAEKVIQSAKDIGLIIAGFTGDAQKEAFAKAVMNSLKDDATAVSGEYSKTKDDTTGVTTEKVSFTDIQDGYYIMTCSAKVGTSGEYNSLSLGMLTIVDGTVASPSIGTGTAKVGLPKVEKKVKEDQTQNTKYNDKATYESEKNAWNDVADYDIGDAVPFKLYGTMPDNLDKYSAYYYCFNDTLDTRFDKPTNVIITIGKTELYYNVTGTQNNGETTWSYKQYTNNEFKDEVSAIDKNCRLTYDGSKFTVAFEDIKAYEGVDKTTVVTVEYNSVLNKTAVVGNKGQNNKVDLTYSNNPNVNYKPNTNDDTPDSPGEDNTGKTPEDIVNVLTYAFKFEKTFFNAANEKLTVEELETGVFTGDKAAQFTLYAGEGDGKTQLKFTKVESTDTVNYGIYDYIIDENGTLTTLELTEIGGNDGDLTTKGDNNLVIRIKGLDEGTYTLSETRAPEGYNKANDQKIVITAITANGQSWNGTDNTLTSFSWTIDGTTAGNQSGASIDATATAEMQNKKGTSLPGTGGIGTTIFYLGGGAMAAIGGVYLISKRRMKKSEE